MSNKKLKEQCFVTLMMVIIMGGVLFATYEAPDSNDNSSLAQAEDVLAGTYSGAGQITGTGPESGPDQSDEEYGGLIRLHVIANSNSDFDQQLKLKVRNRIMKELEGIETSSSIEDTRSFIKSQIDDMTAAADEVIAENGCNYKASAELGMHWIPEKTYGNVHFPAGNYEALVITLGKGEGENWWCVLFPPLCLISDNDCEDVTEAGAASSGVPEGTASSDVVPGGSPGNTGDRIQLKSWIYEIMEK